MVILNRRWRLDLLMAAGLIACMSYSLVGEALHEWLGTAVLVLFLWHLVVRRRWFAGLRRGRWSGSRIFGTALDGLLCFFTLGLVVSSVMLSKYVFAFLPLNVPDGVGATPHQVCAYWGFLVCALHLGQHGHALATMLKQRLALRASLCRSLMIFVCVGGAMAFLWQNLLAHLLLQTRDFAPMGQLPTFLLAYLFIFIFVALIGHVLTQWLQHERRHP